MYVHKYRLFLHSHVVGCLPYRAVLEEKVYGRTALQPNVERMCTCGAISITMMYVLYVYVRKANPLRRDGPEKDERMFDVSRHPSRLGMKRSHTADGEAACMTESKNRRST
jgi:hypothetical protein